MAIAPLLLAVIVASYGSIREWRFYETMAVVVLISFLSAGDWAIECVNRTSATRFLWQDFRFNNYGDDPFLQSLSVVIQVVLSVVIGAPIAGIIFYLMGRPDGTG